MFSEMVLRVGGHGRVQELVTTAPGSRDMIKRFVAGQDLDQTVPVLQDLSSKGLRTTIDFLGEDIDDIAAARETADIYVSALERLAAEGLTPACEVSLKLSAVGLQLGGDGHTLARDNAARICSAARNAGTTVTLDMEDHTTTDATLAVLFQLREDFPDTGAVIQGYLRRSEGDCRDLAGEGSRVRLCKGAYLEPESVAYADKHQVNLSYVRCLKVLMEGKGYPMVASHDPKMITIADDLARRTNRTADDFEFQMLYGIRPLEQRRLVDCGRRVRVYVPYGTDWYGYFLRRLAERPSNAMFFARSLISRR